MTYYERYKEEYERDIAAGKKRSYWDNHFYIRICHGGTKPDTCPNCGGPHPLFWEKTLTWACRECEGSGKRTGPGCASSQFKKGRTAWNKGTHKKEAPVAPARVVPTWPDDPELMAIWYNNTMPGTFWGHSILNKNCAAGRFL